MAEENLEAIEKYYARLAELVNSARQIKEAFSVEEAEGRHKKKQELPEESI